MGNEESYKSPTIHPRFTKVQYSKSPQNKMLIHFHISSTKQILEPWIQKNKLYKHIYHKKQIIFIKNYKIINDGLCGATCQFVAEIEQNLSTNLKEQIEKRSAIGRYYSQPQLWYVVIKIIRTAVSVYDYGEKHYLGNIHPYNILLNHQGDIRILATNYSISFPSQLDHFQSYKINGDSQAFISPELLGFATSTKYPQYPNYPRCIDKQPAEVFSIGMTILSMATLTSNLMKCFNKKVQNKNRQKISNINQSKKFQPLEFNESVNKIDTILDASQSLINLLDFRKDETMNNSKLSLKSVNSSFSNLINHEYLQQILSIVQQKYSNLMYDVIISLIHPQPRTRINLSKLYFELLKPNEGFIQALDDRWINYNKLAKLSEDPNEDFEQEGGKSNVNFKN